LPLGHIVTPSNTHASRRHSALRRRRHSLLRRTKLAPPVRSLGIHNERPTRVRIDGQPAARFRPHCPGGLHRSAPPLRRPGIGFKPRGRLCPPLVDLASFHNRRLVDSQTNNPRIVDRRRIHKSTAYTRPVLKRWGFSDGSLEGESMRTCRSSTDRGITPRVVG